MTRDENRSVMPTTNNLKDAHTRPHAYTHTPKSLKTSAQEEHKRCGRLRVVGVGLVTLDK